MYFFDSKYKADGTYTAAREILSMLRLAEQYLIRAEARSEQGKVSDAAADLNMIRSRAGIGA